MHNVEFHNLYCLSGRANAKRDGTRAETRIGLSAKRTSPFQSAGGSVQSTTGSRGVWIVDARRLATHSIRIFPLHFPSRASPCAIRSRVSYSRVSKKSDKIGEECGMHGNAGNLEQNIDWKMGRKKSIWKACVNVGG